MNKNVPHPSALQFLAFDNLPKQTKSILFIANHFCEDLFVSDVGLDQAILNFVLWLSDYQSFVHETANEFDIKSNESQQKE